MFGIGMREQLHVRGNRLLRPLARRLAAWGVSPNHVTLCGLALNVLAAALIVESELLAAGIVWFLAKSLSPKIWKIRAKVEGALLVGPYQRDPT